MRTLQDEIKRTNPLTNDNEQQLTNKCNSPKKADKQQLESLTRYEIEELMGIRRPRYARRKGVIKQK
ncbi:hypothetical protein [Kurthia huakuii]|uniref:hypothetical protein n=1 Tax=Kurthia huakuii TaxID=1421019 RepID=UPI0004975B41|nr:hypothetical protein [Kurthia huakuii]MBM7699350.1 hypothetical protein [Kurthia huakuii]